jgi:hypothetical protein
MTGSEVHILNLPTGRGRRLYYFQGNFFHPMELGGAEHGLVKRAIRDFMRANRATVDADRADLGYKTLLQLFDATEAA